MHFTRGFYFRMAILLLAVMLLSGTLTRPALTASTQTSGMQAHLRAVIQQARDAWVSGDAAAFANLFTADSELIVPGQRWQGQTAIETETANFLKNFTVAIEIQTILVEGNQAAVAWDWRETPKAGGQTQRAQDAIFIEFAAGQIRRWREYIDVETARQEESLPHKIQSQD